MNPTTADSCGDGSHGLFEHQLIVVYCRSELLAENTQAVHQLLTGLSQVPLPVADDALVVSDNGDIYGTVRDLWARKE